jgi:hypothetical protein
MRQMTTRMMLTAMLVMGSLPVAWAADDGWKPDDQVEANDYGVWRPATVMQVKDGTYFVHYTGWAAQWDTWVTPDRIRSGKATPESGTYRAGDKVEANDNGVWRPATVQEVKDGAYFIAYDGWSAQWNAWLSAAQVRNLPTSMSPTGYKSGDTVEAADGGVWRPATVLQVKDGRYFVHFIGWSDNWDDWRRPDEVRLSTTGAFKPGDLVEVETDGTWRRAMIRTAEANRYFIHIDGSDPSTDVWVETAHIRNLAP